jgi:hypothetical protein
MSFARRLYESRSDVIDAVAHGAGTVEELHAPVVGPVSFGDGRIDYPYVQVLPESTDRQGGNDWQHTIRLNCIFQRTRDADYLRFLKVTLDAVAAAMDELGGVSCVYYYAPTTIEDFAGEDDGDLLVMISAQLTIGSQIDDNPDA